MGDAELQTRRAIENVRGGKIPLVAADAAVCRPAWLMELEGVAIIPDKNKFPPFL